MFALAQGSFADAVGGMNVEGGTADATGRVLATELSGAGQIQHALRLQVCHQELLHLKSLDLQVLMKVQFSQEFGFL